MKRTFALLLSLVMVLTLFTACATTRMHAVWSDPSYQGPPHKVLVYSMLKAPGNRRTIEDEFVRYLKYRNVDAVAGYSVFPGNELVKKEDVEAKLKEGGFDSLLLTRLTGTKREQVQIQTGMAYQPAPYYGNWGGYYATGYSAAYSSSRIVDEDYALAETNLYNVATEKLVFTAASETWVGGNMQATIKEYVDRIMREMQKQKVVP